MAEWVRHDGLSRGPATHPEAPIEAAGFVLAGGRSSRMGTDKALLEIDGEPLIASALRRLRTVCTEVAIAGGAEPLAHFGRVVTDRHPGCGPLSGIVAALEQSRVRWNLFLPVDVPLLPVAALRALLFAAAGWPAVCVMAEVSGQRQPLCAAYARESLPILQEELAAGRWKVAEAIARAGTVQYLRFGQEQERWFANVNTPEEYARVQGVVARGRRPLRYAARRQKAVDECVSNNRVCSEDVPGPSLSLPP